MALFYVGSGGNDASAGTSWGARWLTIGKALSTGNGVANGDTVYVAPGTYREVKSVTLAPTARVNIVGDVSGANTDGVGGPVTMSGFTTNDTSASSGSTTLDLNGKNFFAFKNITIVSGGANAVNCSLSHDCSFTGCPMIAMSPATGALAISTTSAVAANLTFDGCPIVNISSPAVTILLAQVPTADFDYNITFKNCHVEAPSSNFAFKVNMSGSNTNFGGGVRFYSGVVIGNYGFIVGFSDNALSTSIPAVSVYGSIVFGSQGAALFANTSGYITEDYNIVGGSRNGVTAGTHSKTPSSSFYPGFDFGHSWVQGFDGRPFLSPLPGSQAAFFNAQGSMPTTDAIGRPRSPDNIQAVGPYERYNPAVASASGDVGDCDAITGPGSMDVQIALDGTATTITVKCKTSGYTGTNYPQFDVIDNTGAVVNTTSFTVASSSAFESQTSASFTPTIPSGLDGVLYTVRLHSRDGATTGTTLFDTVSAS